MKGIREFDVQNFQTKEISKAIALTEQIYLTVEEIRGEMEMILPLISKLEFLPLFGEYLGAVEPGLDYVSNLTHAAFVMGNTFQPLIEEITNGASKDIPQLIYDFVKGNQSTFTSVEYLVGDAVAAGEQISPDLIPEAYRNDFIEINNILADYQVGFQTLRVLPYLLGPDEPITYLILVQNRDELRASGGFITAFGLFRIREGHILGLKIEDSKNFEFVKEIRQAPQPMKEIMFAHYLVPRDANWSPDFPTAAQDVQEMFYISSDIPTDEVVAFDQQLIVDFLKFSGPLDLVDEEIFIDATNVEEKMIEYKQAAVDDWKADERKDFLSILAPHIINKIQQLNDPDEIITLGKLLYKAIREGHLLIYINKSEAQEILENLELDGAINPPDNGDYLMLVDSNVGIGKIDMFIERSLTYIVNLQSILEPQAEIKLYYEHMREGSEPCLQGRSKNDIPDYFDPRCYWNYWRLFTANGTKLDRAVFDPVPEEYFLFDKNWPDEVDTYSLEQDVYVMGGLAVVPQLDEKIVTLFTNPPASVIVNNNDGILVYKLRIQKQPGISTLPVKIIVKAPSGYTIFDLPEGWNMELYNNEYIWEGQIKETTDFQLEFIINQSN